MCPSVDEELKKELNTIWLIKLALQVASTSCFEVGFGACLVPHGATSEPGSQVRDFQCRLGGATLSFANI